MPARLVRYPGACRDRNESAGSIGDATATPPGERVTPAPARAKPAASKATTPAVEGMATTKPAKGASVFTAVFMIAGLLAVAYAMMRHRG
ncbi:hypothetical protein DRO03_06815 [Methanosarcinales archaeon]|nr:MAG: hypothetical protein DRO03_06815 [Methanosarcinales archaeon]